MTALSRRNALILFATTVILCGANMLSMKGLLVAAANIVPGLVDVAGEHFDSASSDSDDEFEEETTTSYKDTGHFSFHPVDTVNFGGYSYSSDETGLSLAVRRFSFESGIPGIALFISKNPSDSAPKIDFKDEESIEMMKLFTQDKDTISRVFTKEVNYSRVRIRHTHLSKGITGVKDDTILENLAKMVSLGGNFDEKWLEFATANVDYIKGDALFFITKTDMPR